MFMGGGGGNLISGEFSKRRIQSIQLQIKFRSFTKKLNAHAFLQI